MLCATVSRRDSSLEKKTGTSTCVSPSPDHANLPIVIRYQRTAPERHDTGRDSQTPVAVVLILSLGVASGLQTQTTTHIGRWTLNESLC
jgi:hypothetical protein